MYYSGVGSLACPDMRAEVLSTWLAGGVLRLRGTRQRRPVGATGGAAAGVSALRRATGGVAAGVCGPTDWGRERWSAETVGDGESVRVVRPLVFRACLRACVRVVPRLASPGWVSGTCSNGHVASCNHLTAEWRAARSRGVGP